MIEEQEMALSKVKPGVPVRIRALQAGRMAASRLASMGMGPGSVIEVISNPSSGPFIVRARGSRIVLGRGIATRIVVEVSPRIVAGGAA
jgi:ferrous iron transport protein A